MDKKKIIVFSILFAYIVARICEGVFNFNSVLSDIIPTLGFGTLLLYLTAKDYTIDGIGKELKEKLEFIVCSALGVFSTGYGIYLLIQIVFK